MPLVLVGGGAVSVCATAEDAWVRPEDLSNCVGSVGSLDLVNVAIAATNIANNLSGGRFGLRTGSFRPYAINPSCGCYGSCGCGSMSEIDLGMLALVTSVTVDGELLAEDAYELWDNRKMVRVDGGRFACCQVLSAETPATELVLTYGEPVTADAEMAAAEIACELAKAIGGDESCALPKGIQNMTRQNLSVSFVNPSQILKDGFSGLPIVDLWLASLDTAQRRQPGRVVSLSTAMRMRT